MTERTMQRIPVYVTGTGAMFVSVPVDHGSTTLAVAIALEMQHGLPGAQFVILPKMPEFMGLNEKIS